MAGGGCPWPAKGRVTGTRVLLNLSLFYRWGVFLKKKNLIFGLKCNFLKYLSSFTGKTTGTGVGCPSTAQCPPAGNARPPLGSPRELPAHPSQARAHAGRDGPRGTGHGDRCNTLRWRERESFQRHDFLKAKTTKIK